MMSTPLRPPEPPRVVVEVDVPRNLLRIRFRGIVRAADLHAQIGRVVEYINQLRPGFSLLTDLSELEAMDIDSVSNITRIMDQALAAGVKQVIRVIPDPNKDIGFHLLSMTHYRGRVRVATHESLAEAEKSLR